MDGPLELRVLLLLVCASAAFTALSPLIYRRDPGRRKLFLAALMVVLLVTPWWSAAGLWTWSLGLKDVSLGGLAQPVPWLLVAAWWLLGAVLVVRTILQVGRGRRALDALPRLEDPDIASECRRIANTLGVARPVVVRAGPSPCASSLGGLVLVLPPAARGWSTATRSAVLCHELAHLRRRDDRLMLLVRLLTDWYWWMPWLKGLQRRYVEAMEESCDDLASRLLPCRDDYVAGLMRAARSVTAGSAGDVAPDPRWPAWVSLLGHSHLAIRVQRLLVVPRPTLDHADGRWALLWATLAFVIVLTAQPSTIPAVLPSSARLFPLTPIEAEAPAAGAPSYQRPRIVIASFVQEPRSGAWRPLPASAHDPLPVYPAHALAQGLEGEVTVEFQVRPGHSRVIRTAPAAISSSDPSGVLAAAVTRAFEHARGTGFGAGLRAVSVYNNDLTSPPPGSSLRLRKTYRFVLSTADGRSADPSSPGG
jgi:beta-lactamase regulating signal transducer with metallopeptidase domain